MCILRRIGLKAKQSSIELCTAIVSCGMGEHHLRGHLQVSINAYNHTQKNVCRSEESNMYKIKKLISAVYEAT